MNQYINLFDLFCNSTFIYNGLYDITCSICILYFPNNKISYIHSSIFNNTQIDYFTKRILAYWILTYSIPRTIAGFYNYPIIKMSCAITYFIEAITYHNEYKNYKSTTNNALFVIYVSYIYGLISCIQAWNNNQEISPYYFSNNIIYSYQCIIILTINTFIWYLGIYISYLNSSSNRRILFTSVLPNIILPPKKV